MAVYNPFGTKAKYPTISVDVTNPVVGSATAKPISFDADTPIGTSNAAWTASQQARGPKAYVPAKPRALTAQEREMQAIERAAKGRLATANSQADIQRAAMLQTANERIHSQGLDPTSNAAWSMQQRAVDQAGIEGNQIVNSALNQNTEAMLSEQDQMTQRENALTDQQKSAQMTILQGFIEDSTDPAQRELASQELQKLVGLGGDGTTTSKLDFAKAYGTTTSEGDKAAVAKLSLKGIPTTPENITAMKTALDNGDADYVGDLMKNGTFDAATYEAGNKTALDYKYNRKSAADLKSADWVQMNPTQKQAVLNNEAVVRKGNNNYETWDNVGQGDVVSNQGKAYKVVYNPSGKGVYVESLDAPGTFMYFSSDHPGGRATDLESINARYNKRHEKRRSKSFSSVV